jgi:hypothetical protein
MAFTLDKVVPWGRSFAEYVAMFALSEDDLHKRILGCGDGPAAFNVGLTQRGGQVVSVDPLYRFPEAAIRQRIAATYPVIMAETSANSEEFSWTTIKSVDELGRLRLAAMAKFLADFALGLAEGRYRDGCLPKLPFPDRAFDLALCSHLLFLYGEQFSMEFHYASITEMCRVAGEARVFPLLELGAKPSRHLPGVLEELTAAGYIASVISVPYEFQRGGNQMLRVARS